MLRWVISVWLGGRYLRKSRVRRRQQCTTPLPLAASCLPATTAAPPLLLQVGAHRLRSAPRSALRSDPGYTQSRHPSHHLDLHLRLWLRGSTAEKLRRALASPEKRPRSLALTRDGALAVLPPRVYVSPSTTSLQVVQRSLSGGFLIEDAALLDANARSMFDDWEKVSPEKSPTAQGGSQQSKTSTQKPAMSCA